MRFYCMCSQETPANRLRCQKLVLEWMQKIMGANTHVHCGAQDMKEVSVAVADFGHHAIVTRQETTAKLKKIAESNQQRHARIPIRLPPGFTRQPAEDPSVEAEAKRKTKADVNSNERKLQRNLTEIQQRAAAARGGRTRLGGGGGPVSIEGRTVIPPERALAAGRPEAFKGGGGLG